MQGKENDEDKFPVHSDSCDPKVPHEQSVFEEAFDVSHRELTHTMLHLIAVRPTHR